MTRERIRHALVVTMLLGFMATLTLLLRSVGISYETLTDDQITALGRFTKAMGLERLPLWPLLAVAAAGGLVTAASTLAETMELVREPGGEDPWPRVALPLALTLLTLVICMAQFPRLHEAAVIAGAYTCGGILIFAATQAALSVRRNRRRNRERARATEDG